MTAPAPYAGLMPETVLDALQVAGVRGDGRLLALNSYENRVYQVWLEDGGSVVAKFYRPGRWSDAQILEEHAFVQELAAREIPAVAPLALEGTTLNAHAGYRFAVFPRRGGRTPELEDEDTLRWLGRFIGRIHAVGATRAFAALPPLDAHTFGREPRDWLLENGFVPPDLDEAWQSAAALALEGVARCFERAGAVRTLRLHGD
jgi:Ser/Thr protein kinase RdoA (MazF antagonist)